jgi:hypothetical protein
MAFPVYLAVSFESAGKKIIALKIQHCLPQEGREGNIRKRLKANLLPTLSGYSIS